MTQKKLQVLLLERMKELDRWYAEDPPDPEKTLDIEHGVVCEVAEEMARAGFPRLYRAGLALIARRKVERAKGICRSVWKPCAESVSHEPRKPPLTQPC